MTGVGNSTPVRPEIKHSDSLLELTLPLVTLENTNSINFSKDVPVFSNGSGPSCRMSSPKWLGPDFCVLIFLSFAQIFLSPEKLSRGEYNVENLKLSRDNHAKLLFLTDKFWDQFLW